MTLSDYDNNWRKHIKSCRKCKIFIAWESRAKEALPMCKLGRRLYLAWVKEANRFLGKIFTRLDDKKKR